MTFTNDDKKSLIEAINTVGQVTNYMEAGLPTLHALLARLEAAGK